MEQFLESLTTKNIHYKYEVLFSILNAFHVSWYSLIQMISIWNSKHELLFSSPYRWSKTGLPYHVKLAAEDQPEDGIITDNMTRGLNRVQGNSKIHKRQIVTNLTSGVVHVGGMYPDKTGMTWDNDNLKVGYPRL